MSDDFLATILANPARARVLRVFIFAQGMSFSLSQLVRRAGVSAISAAREVRALENLGIIKKGRFVITLANGSQRTVAGKQKEQSWIFNHSFKHSLALSKFVHEVSPVHYRSILTILKQSGRLSVVIVSGSFMGDASRPADLVIAADRLNEPRLERAVRTLERKFGREMRYAALTTTEFRYRLTIQDRLIRDTLDYPHLVLLDAKKLL